MALIDDAIADLELPEEGADFTLTQIADRHGVNRSTLSQRWRCNNAGKTRDPNMAWSHSEAYGSAWENRNLGSIDTYRSCTKGLQKTAYLHLGDCNVKYTKAMKG
jgi:transposase-like protein